MRQAGGRRRTPHFTRLRSLRASTKAGSRIYLTKPGRVWFTRITTLVWPTERHGPRHRVPARSSATWQSAKVTPGVEPVSCPLALIIERGVRQDHAQDRPLQGEEVIDVEAAQVVPLASY